MRREASALCASRLAIENGSAAPTRNENAGWIRSWSEQPCHGTCSVLKATSAQKRLVGEGVVQRPQPHRLGEHEEHDEPAERVDGDEAGRGRGGQRRRFYRRRLTGV